MSQYVLLIHDADDDAWENGTDEDHQLVYDRDEEFGRLLTERGGRITGGAELTHRRQAKVRRRDQPMVTEGPFAETAEVLSGFFIVECDSLDALLELTEVLTLAHDVVEIRPLQDS